MKLLQFNCTANWGSTGKIAEGIGEVAMRRGWESAIAYGRYMKPSRSQVVRVGSKTDVYCHYLRHRLFDGEGLGSRRPTLGLIKWIGEYRPDVIHLHNIHDHWLNYPVLFEYLASVDTPVVWTFHDCWAFTGGCPHFENAGCFKWRVNGCSGGCTQHHSASKRQFESRKELFSALGDRLNIVCVSNWLAGYVRQSFLGVSGAKIRILNNGIGVDDVFTSGGRKEKMILGVSNVWNSEKGLDDFIKLRKMLPLDIGITLVGLSGKQVKDLPTGIEGIERTSNVSELANLYRRAAVFVNPTYNDSFPTVNLEALACGTPVVTYRTGGSPEAVDEKTGLVVEKGDIGGLADAIRTVLSNPDKFKTEDCRYRAVMNFDKEKQFERYIDLYETLIRE